MPDTRFLGNIGASKTGGLSHVDKIERKRHLTDLVVAVATCLSNRDSRRQNILRQLRSGRPRRKGNTCESVFRGRSKSVQDGRGDSVERRSKCQSSELSMTICIAASCADGCAVVVASDRMLTAPFLTVEFDHQDAKIDQIGSNCVALSSGDALPVQDVLGGGIRAAIQLQNPPIATLTDQIQHEYQAVRKRRINDLLLGTRGIDFDSFYQGGMIGRFPQDLSMLIDREVQIYDLGITILIAGVDDFGAHIYNIANPGSVACFDRIGYHAIGSGHRHAVLKLVALGQHRSTSINQTVFNVFCAKKVAELAPGVGQATTMKIVFKEGTKDVAEDVLVSLKPAYELHANPINDSILKVIKKLPLLDRSEGHDGSAKQ